MRVARPISNLCGQASAFGSHLRFSSRSQFHSSAYVASSSKPKVLLLDQIKLATDELSQLSKVANVVESAAKTRQDLVDKFKSGGEYSDIVGIYRHFGGARSVRITGRFDPELVSQLPKSLRYIVHNGAGYDQLDISALSEKESRHRTFRPQSTTLLPMLHSTSYSVQSVVSPLRRRI